MHAVMCINCKILHWSQRNNHITTTVWEMIVKLKILYGGMPAFAFVCIKYIIDHHRHHEFAYMNKCMEE